MDEWQVIAMLITLGGGMALIVKPIVNLTKAITELTYTCRNLDSQFANFEMANKNSHQRIWDHVEIQDKTLDNHEQRISRMEGEKGHEKN